MTDSNILAVIAIVFALIAASIGGFALYYGGEKGEIGLTGPQGDIGPTGGEQGIPGEDGEIGSAGPAGPKGDNGSSGSDGADGNDGNDGTNGEDGTDGIDGVDGVDGQDYVNDVPVIIVDDSASYVTGCSYNTDYNFHINISFDDTENDFKKVALYYKWNPKDDWQLEDNWFYQSNGDYCTDWETIDYGYGPRILHWLVEVMDGYNLEYLEGNTTLYKPVC